MDLGANYSITDIKYYNRNEDDGQGWSDFQIFISDIPILEEDTLLPLRSLRVTDSSNSFNGAYDGVILGNPPLITTGRSALLDSTSKISGHAAIDFSDNALSVCAWIKPSSGGFIASKNDPTRDDFSQFMFRADSNGSLSLRIEKGSVPSGYQVWITPAGLFDLNTEHYVCAVWRRSNFDITDTLFYIDGVEVLPATFNQNGIYDLDFVLDDSSTEWRIGSVDHHDVTQSDRINGQVDEVAIYNYALTVEQIQQHFIQGLGL